VELLISGQHKFKVEENEGQKKSSFKVMVGGKGRKDGWKRNLNEIFITAELELTYARFGLTLPTLGQ
jgi:hypothetical protein